MTPPMVSIIIPVFNTRSYLQQCLDSLTAQTLKPVEIICVDNGSTDGSYKYIVDYAKERSSNMLVMRHTEGRQGGARNAALAIAKGQYIGFVDSDDFVAPEMFETLFSIAQSSEADVAICNAQTYIQEQGYGQLSLPVEVLSNKESITIKQCPALLRNTTICNRLFSNEFIKKHHLRFPEGLYGQDQLFVIKALALADRIVTVPSPFYFYRKNRMGSVSEYRGRDCMHVFAVWQKISDFVQSTIHDEVLKHLINEARIVKYLYSYNSADNRTQKQYFSRMKADFKTLELEKQPAFLTPTEKREYQIVIRYPFVFYDVFLRLRMVYGKLHKYTEKFSKSSSAKRNK